LHSPFSLEDWFFHKTPTLFYFLSHSTGRRRFGGCVAFSKQLYLCFFAMNNQAENTMSNDDYRMVPLECVLCDVLRLK